MMQTNDLEANYNAIVAISPIHRGYFYDGHGAKGAFVLIGFLNEKPVYRTTHTLAHCKNTFLEIESSLVNYFFYRPRRE
jgi:hypothetical protein